MQGSLIPLKLLPLCLFVFLGIMYREVLMDITDEAGDREAGVRTIPVVAGAHVCSPFGGSVGAHGSSQFSVSDKLTCLILRLFYWLDSLAGPNTALTVATLFIMGAGSLLGYAALHGQGLAWAVSQLSNCLCKGVHWWTQTMGFGNLASA